MRHAYQGLLGILLLGGCSSQPALAPNEYLDPVTAVTIRAVAQPITFARDSPELGANVRDYLSAGVVDVNNMGAHKFYLALVSWSTVDRRGTGAAPTPVPEQIEILVGGVERVFSPLTHESRSLGIGLPLFRPPSGYAGESWYLLSGAEVQALATAPPASIALRDSVAGRVTYLGWRSASGELLEFARDLPTPTGSEVRRR